MSPREVQVIDLHEAGKSRDEIATELRVSPTWIDIIVRLYSFEHCLDSSVTFERKARAGSRALLKAIRATGKVHS